MRFLRWSDYLSHSAKGSTWEKHKYIKRIDGTYYYPDSYEGGRHLPDGNSDKSKEEMSDEDKKASEFRDKLNELLEKNEAYYDPNEEMDLEGFRDFYEDILQSSSEKISDEQMKKIFDSFKKQENEKSSEAELSEKDIDALAREVWKGNFGNGAQRKELLGEYYDQVQKKVNEIAGSVTGNRKTSTATKEEIDTLDKAVEKASKKSSSGSKSKGIDMEQVFSVYRRKQQ